MSFQELFLSSFMCIEENFVIHVETLTHLIFIKNVLFFLKMDQLFWNSHNLIYRSFDEKFEAFKSQKQPQPQQQGPIQ